MIALCLCAVASAAGIHEGTLRADDGTALAYREAGHGPAVILIPGWTMPAWIWDGQLDRLAADHRVVALDLRGQGRSGGWTRSPSLGRLARDVEGCARALALGPVVVVGWSLGAEVALAWAALRDRSPVRGLVLADQPLVRRGPRTGEFGRRLVADRRGTTTGFVRRMFHRPVDEAFLAALTRDALAVPEGICHAMLGLAFPRARLGPLLAGLPCPVAYVAAGNRAAEADDARMLAPSVRATVLAGAGHAVFVDEPARFADIIRGMTGPP